MPTLNLAKAKNTWINTNRANSENGWDPNKLVVPGYDNGQTPQSRDSQNQNPRDTVDLRKPENQHTKDESKLQWLRRQMGF